MKGRDLLPGKTDSPAISEVVSFTATVLIAPVAGVPAWTSTEHDTHCTVRCVKQGSFSG